MFPAPRIAPGPSLSPDLSQSSGPDCNRSVPWHVYEVRPRKDHRGVDLISDVLPFGRLWYVEVSDAIEYAKFRSRSHEAVIPRL